MQGNVLGQSGGSGLSSGLNVYAQLAEPSKKEGVWIKTEETVVDENTTLPEISKYKYDKVELMENSDIVGKGIYTKLANIPYPLNSGSAVAIGTNVYLLGNSSGTDYSNYVSNNYKYDTTTNKYTKLADIPYPFNDGCATVVEKYMMVYIFVWWR